MIHKDAVGRIEFSCNCEPGGCSCEMDGDTRCPDALRFTAGLAELAAIVERIIVAGKWGKDERKGMLAGIDRVKDAARRDY